MIFRNKYNSSRLILLLLSFITQNVFAQFSLTIEITATPAVNKSDKIYVAGNFNNWNPADDNFSFIQKNNSWVKQIKNLAANTYEFKFTRGGWDKVEANFDGADVTNRVVRLTADTVIRLNIAAWKDDFATIEKKHTASPQVIVLDTSLYMPQLKRTRKIRMYLPKDYSTAAKRYPVLYMHDGQNLFDERTSGFGEWGVDECMDSLIAKGKPPCIIVGIDCSFFRLCTGVMER